MSWNIIYSSSKENCQSSCCQPCLVITTLYSQCHIPSITAWFPQPSFNTASHLYNSTVGQPLILKLLGRPHKIYFIIAFGILEWNDAEIDNVHGNQSPLILLVLLHIYKPVGLATFISKLIAAMSMNIKPCQVHDRKADSVKISKHPTQTSIIYWFCLKHLPISFVRQSIQINSRVFHHYNCNPTLSPGLSAGKWLIMTSVAFWHYLINPCSIMISCCYATW